VKPALVISARDNVATALETLERGRAIAIDGATITAIESIPRGHKIAIRAIAAGEAVVKYGSPIGKASVEIAPGAHVHTHNVESGRGRGDLQATAPRRSAKGAEAGEPANTGEEGRLAEPLE
jgi:altronate dehydratase